MEVCAAIIIPSPSLFSDTHTDTHTRALRTHTVPLLTHSRSHTHGHSLLKGTRNRPGCAATGQCRDLTGTNLFPLLTGQTLSHPDREVLKRNKHSQRRSQSNIGNPLAVGAESLDERRLIIFQLTKDNISMPQNGQSWQQFSWTFTENYHTLIRCCRYKLLSFYTLDGRICQHFSPCHTNKIQILRIQLHKVIFLLQRDIWKHTKRRAWT